MADEGYAKIASLMSHHPELAVFRRFSKLNFQTILYLQAELTQLEADLKDLVVRDQTETHRAVYSKHWWYLAHSEEDHDNGEQWDKALQIRKTLKEYNDHLQQAVFLANLKHPKAYDINLFRSWMRRPKMGNFPLLGPDHDSWSQENNDDLVAISRRESTDPLSSWLTNNFVPWFHHCCGKRFKKPISHDPKTGIAHYREGKIQSAINILVTVIASLIPITSILILYFVSNMLDRLAIVVAFTALFAFCLAITTKARRVEVFAATSAFAAVQVVFITGSNGSVA